MTFFTPNIPFLINPLFALGNCLGNCLNKNFSGGYYSCFGGWSGVNMYSGMSDPYIPSVFSTDGFRSDFSPLNFNTCNNIFNITFNNSFNGAFNTPLFSGVSGTDNVKYTGGLKGYNAEKGNRLANDALKHSIGFTEQCARFVYNALERTRLNTNMNRAHGYYLRYEFRKNPNFKEVPVSSVNWKNLPAGCILLYKPGSQGYHKKYGHVEISTGKKTAVSDGITHNIRKPDAVFIPV